MRVSVKNIRILPSKYLKALNMLKITSFGSATYSLLRAYCTLAEVLSTVGKMDEALEYHEAALKIRIELLGSHYQTAASYYKLGLIYRPFSLVVSRYPPLWFPTHGRGSPHLKGISLRRPRQFIARYTNLMALLHEYYTNSLPFIPGLVKVKRLPNRLTRL